ncbi:hypothetical protein [Synechocystis sp. LKSZ1]|uniref:hypothetical protein n=1 Tax=Synechocystis sp. LKSZ1 TaxID=3144951 RepID=UPI00336BDBE1
MDSTHPTYQPDDSHASEPTENNSPIRLPAPDLDNITVLTEELPNAPILPWHHYDSPWLETESLTSSVSESASLPNIQVLGSIYTGPHQIGDFSWMIEQPEYQDALFIFNDNEEQFLAHQQDPDSSLGCARGGGNAVIRPYQCQAPPRATGIPTGSQGQGYSCLTTSHQQVIDQALEVIRSLVATGRYQRVIYSADPSGQTLGTGIFQVAEEVKAYIVAQLQQLAGSRPSD